MSRVRVSFLLIVCLLLSFVALPCAAASVEDFSLTILSISETGDMKNISFQYDNQTGSEVVLGWVRSCELVVTTDEGTFSKVIHNWDYDRPLSTGQGVFSLAIDDCPGTVQTVELTDVIVLDDRGLPAEELGSITVDPSGAEVTVTAPSEDESKLPAGFPDLSDLDDLLDLDDFDGKTPSDLIPDHSSRPSGTSFGTIVLYIICGLAAVGVIVFTVIELRKFSHGKSASAPSKDTLSSAGDAGEKAVDFNLSFWILDNAGYTAIAKDCFKHDKDCIVLKAPEGNASEQEFDHIVVGPAGIIHIETKYYRGEVHVEDDVTWRRVSDGVEQKPPKSGWCPCDQVRRHEAVLKSISKGRLPVFSMICMTHKDVQLFNAERCAYPVFKIEHLFSHLDALAKDNPAHPDEVVREVIADIEKAKVHRK